MRGEQPHVITPHAVVRELVVAGFVRRVRLRQDMNDFVRGDAPSYLCWYADEPVGKTAFLADYAAVHRPRQFDVLNFFVSAEHGTDRRSAFEAEITAQIAELLNDERLRVPADLGEWEELFKKAATHSNSLDRRLLLIVDGLDDDLAWSGLADGEGSIAALLPATPPVEMRVIVSVRNFQRFPADLPPSHPLRDPDHQRQLPEISSVFAQRRTLRTKTPLGNTVTQLLAVARGGLRPTDLAELTGSPAERIDRLLHGPEGRGMCQDDPVAGTYRLASEELADQERELLGADGVARHTRTLLTWSTRWRDAGWPADTPPYPLAHELPLLVGAVDRSSYILDLVRLRRLVESTAPWVAVGQLDAFAAESDAIGLGVSVPVAATRALLTGEAREVPPGAPALLVRLGEAANARGLARFTPGSAAKALRLAEVAVELAVTRGDGADDVAQEAADWLARVDDLSADPDTYAQIATAADTLMKRAAPEGARALVGAVLRAPAPGPEALTTAAGVLATMRDERVATALFERAEDLVHEGEWRSRAAAVETWGMLGRGVPSLSVPAANAVCAVCQDVEATDGLGAVEILAVAAIALARLASPRYRKAKEISSEALARIRTVWPDPDVLSEDDQAQLCRELGGALARLARADDVSERTRAERTEIEAVLNEMPEQLRAGAFGEGTTEQARHFIEGAQKQRDERAQTEESARAKAKDEARKQTRRTNYAKKRKTDRPYTPAPPPAPRLPKYLSLLQDAQEQQRAGENVGSRASVMEALQCFDVPQGGHPGWTLELTQALGTTGDFATGHALAEAQDDVADRVRHIAALSLGCSLGDHTDEALRYAHDAARLLPTGRDATLATVVARAFAWAGEAVDALALATTQALPAVAAGLVRHHPDQAARIAEPLIRTLTQRVVRGSRLLPLPDLAALLLASPDDPVLREALGRAAEFAADPALSRNRPIPPVLPVLAKLGCLPDNPAPTVTNAITAWRQSPPPGPEFALLCALDGDIPALLRHANGRPLPIWTAATYFTGRQVPLATDNRAEDRGARICLALAQASDHREAPDTTTATDLTRTLVQNGDWPHTFPLLPHVAPNALPRLAAIAAGARGQAVL